MPQGQHDAPVQPATARSVDVRQNTMPFLPFKSFEQMTEHLKQDVYVNQDTYAHL